MKTFLLIFLGAIALSSSCKKGNDNGSNKPTARFSINGYEKPSPCVISFINISGNSTSYVWDFGDGSGSTEFNPTHTYNFAGSYLLKLRATGPNGADSVCKLVAIESPPATNQSAFSYYQEKCNGTPVGISFKTINPLSTIPVWNFGNGTIASERDPIVQYLLRGDYTIKYSTVINGVRDTVTRIIRIE
jgi:PKD repeat protein